MKIVRLGYRDGKAKSGEKFGCLEVAGHGSGYHSDMDVVLMMYEVKVVRRLVMRGLFDEA